MTQSDQRKFFGTLIGLAICVYTLWPTFRFYAMSPAQRQEVLQARPAAATNEVDRARLEKLAQLREKAIKLGLDLQGGMYLLLEVDKSKLGPAEAKNAVDQAMQIIRNRVDQFGVAEPSIQKQGENRILIQLPGLLDQERAKELIGQTALLEFKLVKTDDESRAIFDRIDGYLARKTFGHIPDSTAADSLRHPLSSRFLYVVQNSESFALTSEVAAIDSMLDMVRADSTFVIDAALAWAAHDNEMQGRSGRVFYVLSKDPLMKGTEVASAQMRLDLDQERPGAPGVSFTLTGRGGALFADITGANVGRQLAIVLDNKVQSAPTIHERIPRGQASITGTFTEEDAQDLAIVLRAGALPAPVNIIEERTVGPSLGQDSIDKGLHAGADRHAPGRRLHGHLLPALGPDRDRRPGPEPALRCSPPWRASAPRSRCPASRASCSRSAWRWTPTC